MQTPQNHPSRRASLRTWQRCALLLPLVLLGCSDPDSPKSVWTYDVRGKVLLAGEKPLSGGMVHFENSEELAPGAEGKIGPDGSFTLSTPNLGEGVAAGKYKVWVTPDDTVGVRKLAGTTVRDARRFPFPARYADPDATTLKTTITPGSDRLEPFRLAK